MKLKISHILSSIAFFLFNLVLLIYLLFLMGYITNAYPFNFFASDALMWFFGGMVVFFFLNLIVPETMGFFLTFEHEFVHLIAALFTFHGIQSFRVEHRKGGMVKIKGQNVIIALAPYYIPFLLFVFVLLRHLSHYTGNPVWYMLFGFSEGFFLFRFLRDFHPGQPDFKYKGIFLSLFHILVLNMAVQGGFFLYFTGHMPDFPLIFKAVNDKFVVVFLNLFS